MNRNTTIGLILVLGVAVIGLWWATSSRTEPGASQAAGPHRLIDPPLDDLTSYEILPAGAASPMKFVMEGDKWRMAAPVPGPADHNTVLMSLGLYRDMNYSKAYASGDAERPSDNMTGLTNPVRTVTMTDKAGRTVSLKIGARLALAPKTYVQKQGDDTIFLVDTDVSVDLRRGLADYRGKRLADFATADAVRVEVSGDRQFTLVKDGERWNIDAPYKARADTAAVHRILMAAYNLTVNKYVDDEAANLRPYGLESPRSVVAITAEKKTLKPPPAGPTSAPAEPEYDVQIQKFTVALGGVADDVAFARLLEPAMPSVFEVSHSSIKDLELGVDDLRDKTVVALGTKAAQKIVYTAGGRSVTVVKNQASQWEMQPDSPTQPARPAEFAAVEDVLRHLRDMKATGFESTPTPDMGFDDPRAVIEVTLEGQVEPLRLTVAGLTPSKTGAYVRNEQDNAIAVIPAKAAEELAAGTLAFWSRDLVSFKRDRAMALEITRDGQTIRLAKQDAGWRVVAPVDGDCEQGMLNSALADLSALRGRRVVGVAADAARFGLDRPAVRAMVTVEPPPPPPPTTQEAERPPAPPPERHALLLTRQAVGDESRVYAMVEGGDRICEVDARVMENLEAELFSTRIVSLEPSQVTRLSCSGAANFTFERVGENWRLRGEDTFPVDSAKLTDFFSTLRDLRAARFVRYDGARPADFGLDNPGMTFTLHLEDGEPVSLMVASRGPDSQSRFGAVAAAPGRVFVIKSDDVLKLNVGIQTFQRPN